MIFYLSCTGNTLWAAKLIAAATSERLVSMAEVLSGDCRFSLDADERIGFCFPVHGWRPPKLVRKFISRMELSGMKNNYCYALCTTGDTIGETMDIFQRDLATKGLHADSLFSLIMPESYVGLPFMDVDTPQKELQKKQEAAQEMKSICDIITARRAENGKLVLGRWKRINSRLIGAFFLKKLITDKPFHIDSSRCVRCGTCARACPVGDIDWKQGEEPTWKHNGDCLSCFSCYHHCPSHAIEYGRRTQKKGQYYYNRCEVKKNNVFR